MPCRLLERRLSISIVLFFEAPKAREFPVETAPPEPEAALPYESEICLNGFTTAPFELTRVAFVV